MKRLLIIPALAVALAAAGCAGTSPEQESVRSAIDAFSESVMEGGQDECLKYVVAADQSYLANQYGGCSGLRSAFKELESSSDGDGSEFDVEVKGDVAYVTSPDDDKYYSQMLKEQGEWKLILNPATAESA